MDHHHPAGILWVHHKSIALCWGPLMLIFASGGRSRAPTLTATIVLLLLLVIFILLLAGSSEFNFPQDLKSSRSSPCLLIFWS